MKIEKTMENTCIRRYDLDWLRVLAVLLLVPFHSALVFNQQPYILMYVKDSVHSVFLDNFAGWIHQFHMPLLFFISGAACYFSLKKRSVSQFIKERNLKLLIPAIGGIIIIIPIITFIALKSQGIDISFLKHFLSFWQFSGCNLSGLDGKFTPAHLWFLFYLFAFSLAALPIFCLALKEHNLFCRFRFLTAPILPHLLFFICLYASARLNLFADKNPVYYFVCFFAGFVFMTDQKIQQQTDRLTILFVVLGILCYSVRFLNIPILHTNNLSFLIEQLGRWAWLLGILGFGHKVIKKGSPCLKYLSDNSFHFYILHLLPNTFVAYFIVQTSWCISVKYAVIVILTFISTFLLCEIIKRIPILRNIL